MKKQEVEILMTLSMFGADPDRIGLLGKPPAE
jgi:hypothetical protein